MKTFTTILIAAFALVLTGCDHAGRLGQQAADRLQEAWHSDDTTALTQFVAYYASLNDSLSLLDTRSSVNKAFIQAGWKQSDTLGIASEIIANGEESAAWFRVLANTLDALAEGAAHSPRDLVAALLEFELVVLDLSGLSPGVEAESGAFSLRGERQMPISNDVARCINDPGSEKNMQILVDAARAIGVFYVFHLDSAPEARRTVLRMISNNEEGTGTQNGKD